MKNEVYLKNKNLELYLCGPQVLGLIITNPRLANKINSVIKSYKDYNFKAPDEALFKLNPNELKAVLPLLKLSKKDKLKSNILEYMSKN